MLGSSVKSSWTEHWRDSQESPTLPSVTGLRCKLMGSLAKFRQRLPTKARAPQTELRVCRPEVISNRRSLDFLWVLRLAPNSIVAAPHAVKFSKQMPRRKNYHRLYSLGQDCPLKIRLQHGVRDIFITGQNPCPPPPNPFSPPRKVTGHSPLSPPETRSSASGATPGPHACRPEQLSVRARAGPCMVPGPDVQTTPPPTR